MPDPHSDVDQLRFAQIQSRMLDGLVKHLPMSFVEQSGTASRAGLRDKLCESTFLMAVVETCAYVSQEMEEETGRK